MINTGRFAGAAHWCEAIVDCDLRLSLPSANRAAPTDNNASATTERMRPTLRSAQAKPPATSPNPTSTNAAATNRITPRLVSESQAPMIARISPTRTMTIGPTLMMLPMTRTTTAPASDARATKAETRSELLGL